LLSYILIIAYENKKQPPILQTVVYTIERMVPVASSLVGQLASAIAEHLIHLVTIEK
jgi:hypothetical protein